MKTACRVWFLSAAWSISSRQASVGTSKVKSSWLSTKSNAVATKAIFDRHSELSFEQPSVAATNDCAGSSRTLAIRLSCCSDGRWYGAKLATFLCPDTRATSLSITPAAQSFVIIVAPAEHDVYCRERQAFSDSVGIIIDRVFFPRFFSLNQHSSSGHSCGVRDPLIAYWNSRSFLGFSLRRSLLMASTWPGSMIRPAETAFWSRPDPPWWLLVTYSVESMK